MLEVVILLPYTIILLELLIYRVKEPIVILTMDIALEWIILRLLGCIIVLRWTAAIPLKLSFSTVECLIYWVIEMSIARCLNLHLINFNYYNLNVIHHYI